MKNRKSGGPSVDRGYGSAPPQSGGYGGNSYAPPSGPQSGGYGGDCAMEEAAGMNFANPIRPPSIPLLSSRALGLQSNSRWRVLRITRVASESS